MHTSDEVVPSEVMTVSSSYMGHISSPTIVLLLAWCGCTNICVMAYEIDTLNIYARTTAKNDIIADTILCGIPGRNRF